MVMKIRPFVLFASLLLWACNPDNGGIKTVEVPLSVDKTSVDFRRRVVNRLLP